jgi:hypothetical protein
MNIMVLKLKYSSRLQLFVVLKTLIRTTFFKTKVFSKTIIVEAPKYILKYFCLKKTEASLAALF